MFLRIGYRFIFLIMLSFGLPQYPAWAADSEPSAQPPVPAPPTAMEPRGTLYRVRYQDHTSYLFGTIHVGRPEFFPLEERATQAFAQAGTYALEIDMRDNASLQNAVKKYGMYADNDTLDKHLSPASLDRVKQALNQAGIPFDAVAHAKAWMLANIFDISLFERHGYHAEQGVDVTLMQSAMRQGKTIRALESADYQLSLFGGMSDQQQEEYLNDTLDEMQSGEWARKMQELIDAWQHADEKALDALLHEMRTDQTMAGRFFRREIVDKRNPRLARSIESVLKRDQASFVGIGVLHLLGSDGVPQLLARRGYEVTRLY